MWKALILRAPLYGANNCKTLKKDNIEVAADNVCWGGGGWGLPQFIHYSLILPGPQITWKWTMHTDKLTTKCHICLHT